jgi:hypothetical protein
LANVEGTGDGNEPLGLDDVSFQTPPKILLDHGEDVVSVLW